MKSRNLSTQLKHAGMELKKFLADVMRGRIKADIA